MTDRNLTDWKEILAGAESDERGSRESLEDYERTLIKVRERHEQDVRFAGADQEACGVVGGVGGGAVGEGDDSVIIDRPYSDWFGKGNVGEDIDAAIVEHGVPLRIFVEPKGYMAALVYEDKIVAVGYDGNEYCHNFILDERAQ